jgi:hypothetical protein
MNKRPVPAHELKRLNGRYAGVGGRRGNVQIGKSRA